MILGFTGTRQGLTAAQKAALPNVVAALPERFIHGGAMGADTQFHRWLAEQYRKVDDEYLPVDVYPAFRIHYQNWSVVLGPLRGAVVHLEDDPLERNRIIVERCDHLLACPATMEEALRSGTWATIRHARRRQRAHTIIWPNGTVTGGFGPERSLS